MNIEEEILSNVNNTASASYSSTAADPLVGEYDVFLSFCGQDTRKTFTDCLYVMLTTYGFRTFRDDNELRVGEEIGPELLKAIKDSKISVPIFSTNYASSKWCMRELALMAERQGKGEQMILPVFYDVSPYVVRHQSESYEKAFRQHKENFDEKIVQEWKEALTKIGKLKGLELEKETGGYQGELVKIIAEKVFESLDKSYTHECKNLVGMENHIKKMEELLNFDSKGIRVIGIHGMGGLGKTTIAKAIYNKIRKDFKCHSFLNDVRETSESHNGIVLLQNQLRSEILKTKISDIVDYNEGLKKIKDTVHGKKVLIVFDDVDKDTQIEQLVESYKWFGAGSRIIITTRNEEVLRALQQTCQIEGHLEVYGSYKPGFMNHEDSLELFCKYAFRSKSPLEGYYSLSKEVVSGAAGLPLVLVVTGSSLFVEMDKDLWKEQFKELKNIPREEVLKKLRLSFDPLSDVQKEIFLDIACLFIGQDKTNPCYMWADCEFCPKNALNVLVRKSLITVGDDNTLRMHDQLRDLGRQIVSEGQRDDLGKWSRLWHKDKAWHIFRNDLGTENVKALDLDGDFGNRVIAGGKFRNLKNLRYLTLNGARLDGDFEHCLANLRWLRWNRCSARFTATNFQLSNLVILDLSDGDIMENSNLWNQIQMSKNLKVLNLSCCRLIRNVPYLSTFSNLERLVVRSCDGLWTLDGIEELESLRYLDARRWHSLTRLPNLSRLRKLEELKVSDCRLIEIPGLDKLKSLERLYMPSCELLVRLPDLSNLEMLKTLDVSNCTKLIGIQGLDRLGSLELLNIRGCSSMETLPDLSNLKRLKELDASSVVLTEIRGLHGLELLEVLNMSNCKCIGSVFDLSNLKRLRKLEIRSSIQLIEIRGLEELKFLEYLDIGQCKSIVRLPDFSNLMKLKVIIVIGCKKLTEIPGLEKLKSLEYLNIGYCKSIESIPNFSNLTKLRVLKVTGCEKLTKIPGLEELKSLEHLDIGSCKSIESLPDFSNLTKLEVIIVTDCEKLTKIRGLDKLESLGALFIRG